jgi:RNA polymerase sigma factor (sigma-70 family)
MARPGLSNLVACLRQALPPPDAPGLSDGQLLERFLAERDEAAFAALVRRHGPLVFGVCRRVLGNVHDAEDAFQAAFLVLARKAKAVLKRAAVGSWLYTVAYRTALEARAANARRRQVEKQVSAMPHPEVAPPEPQDWRPLLDQELSRLPEKYRAPVVLCDLGGVSRRDAARQLSLSEGTLSSRLATARRMLAKRLARHGLALSGGALAAALSQGAASAHVPMPLVWSTAKAAALVAAGQLAAVATPAALLTKGVLKTMFLAKLKAAAVMVAVLAALGVSGFVCYTSGGSGTALAAPPEKAPNELEELRKENDLLKINLRVTLEKIKAQEAELLALKDQVQAANRLNIQYRLSPVGTTSFGTGSISTSTALPLGTTTSLGTTFLGTYHAPTLTNSLGITLDYAFPLDPVAEAEAALKALHAAKDQKEKRKAADELENALKKLKEQLK